MATVALLMVLVTVLGYGRCDTCGHNDGGYKKAGCFKRNKELFSELLITDLDPTHDKWGKVDIDWAHLHKSLHSLACRCEEKARGKYSYFALGFYGECWAGSNTKALKEKILNPGAHASSACIGGNYEACDPEHHHECAGVEDNEYVYEIVSKVALTDLTNEKIAEHLGKVYRFKSDNYPKRMMRHRGFEMWLDKSNVNAALYEKDSSFKVVSGLSGKGISFQSSNYPDRYLRHRGWLCYIDRDDGTDLFKKDASFIPRAGLAAPKSVSFESVNYPGYYIRHAGFRVRVNKYVNIELFKHDATWLPELVM